MCFTSPQSPPLPPQPLECTGDYTYFSTVLGSTLTPLGLSAAAVLVMTSLNKFHLAGKDIVIYLAYIVLPSTSRVLFKFLVCDEVWWCGLGGGRKRGGGESPL